MNKSISDIMQDSSLYIDPNASALEQHVRNFSHHGFPYQIIEKDPSDYPPHKHHVKRNSISPSRSAAKKALERDISRNQLKSQKDVKKDKKKSRQPLNDVAHALNACSNAAHHEIMAERRDIEKSISYMKFDKKVQKRVNRQVYHEKKMEAVKTQRHAEELRKIINDVVMHCNGKPVKFTRQQENTNPNESQMGAPGGPNVIRDLTLSKGPMAKKDKKGDKNAKGAPTATVVEVTEQPEINLGAAFQKLTLRAQNSQMGRDIMRSRYVEKPASDHESKKSAKKKGRGKKHNDSIDTTGSPSPVRDPYGSVGSHGNTSMEKSQYLIPRGLLKPRDYPQDFHNVPKTLSVLNVSEYDKVRDMNELQITIQKEIIENLKINWKTLEEDKLRALIRKQVIAELMKIEERKQVRREREEQKRKEKEKREREEDELEASILEARQGGAGRANAAGASPTKQGFGVSFYNQSVTSSPMKSGLGRSPTRKYDGGSSMDTRSMMSKSVMSGSMIGGRPSELRKWLPFTGDTDLNEALRDKVPDLIAGGAFQSMIAGGSPDRTSGLTMMNPSLRKLDQRSKMGGARSQTSRTRSVGTRSRRTGTMSRKSQNIDFDEMQIEDIENLIHQVETQINVFQTQVKKIHKDYERKKIPTEAKMKALLEEPEAELKKFREQKTLYLQIKDAKIPWYDKLPKDNQFSKHFMANIQSRRMKEAAITQAEEERITFQDVYERLQIDQRRSTAYETSASKSYGKNIATYEEE